MLGKKKKKSTLPDDELTARLRAAARKRRPWTLPGLLITLVVLSIPAALVVWWLYPRPELPPLELVAFDQLGLPGTNVTIRACLEPIHPSEEEFDLSGQAIVFEQEATPLNTAKRQPAEALTNREGEASATWALTADKVKSTFFARQVDRNRPGKSDAARIFVVPAETPLLLVDVQQTLANAGEDAWRTKNILDITPATSAGKSLQTIAKRNYQVVYLATDPDRPLIYRKLRGWVTNQQSASDPFPPGPVLGRSSFGQNPSQALETLLRDLRQKFSGPLSAVVGKTESAAVCRAVGLETIVMGEADAPLEAAHVKSWAEVPGKLKKK